MKKIWLNNKRRFTVFLLMACMVLGNLSDIAGNVLAEETKTETSSEKETDMEKGETDSSEEEADMEEEKTDSSGITDQKIELSIDWDQWSGAKKDYDGTSAFVVDISITEDMVIVKDKDSYDISEDDRLTVTGHVPACDVQAYDTFTIEHITVDHPDQYDISEISIGEIQFDDDKLTIEKAGIKVEPFVIYTQYRNGTIEWERTKENISGFQMNDILKDELQELLGNPKLQKETESSYIFENMAQEESTMWYVEDANVRFLFEGSQTPVFPCEFVPERLHLSLEQMLQNMKITQNGVSRFSNAWCNGEEITATIRHESEYDNAYGAFLKFYRLDCEGEADFLQTTMQSGNISGSTELSGLDAMDKEAYYGMFFSENQEVSDWKYDTTAAIIHIVPEQQYDSKKDYPDSIECANGTYPVINLYVDVTAPEVVFMDSGLNRDKQDGEIKMEEKERRQITFEIRNTGFDVSGIEYAFAPVQWKTDHYVEEQPVSYKALPINGDNIYTVSCPEKDGDYMICVLTKNAGGTEETYRSNGFFIDNTNPEITAQFRESEGAQKDLTDAIGKKEDTYTDQTVHAQFTLKETHLKDVRVTITATQLGEDGKSQPIDSLTEYIREREMEIRNAFSKEIQDEQTAFCDFTETANYTVAVTVEDQAGLSTGVMYRFTVDKENPDTGTVLAEGSFHSIRQESGKEKGEVTLRLEKFKKVWNTLLDQILYNIFSQKEIRVTLNGGDRISPVDIYYYITKEEMTERELRRLAEDNWIPYSSKEKAGISLNRKEIVYERVVDRAGNESYFCSGGMVTDDQAPEIDLRMDKQANENGFYNRDVPFSAYIEEKIPDGGDESAGLQYVSYRILKDGKSLESKTVYNAKKNQDVEKKEHSIRNGVICAEQFNSNDVRLYVTAIDNAGNKKEVCKNLKMDTVKPKISVRYEDEPGLQYYDHGRTATITIWERNLDIHDVKIAVKSEHGSRVSIGTWEHSPDVGKSDDAIHTCKVVFSGDDDYQFMVSCKDQAGNPAQKDFSDAFTIDTTKPEIAVSYRETAPEQNAYYNHTITAVITITEHNFDARKAEIQTNTDTGHTDSIPKISGFQSSGDTHTATVCYDTDGTYGLEVSYTDEAGNAADSFHGKQFVIDRTKPEIIIRNLENQSANKEAVKPVITCKDANYDSEQIDITVTGANSGSLDLKKVGFMASDIADGQQFTMDFPKTEEMDDVYILTAKVTDRAGNTKESSIDFSVNRYGSVYTLETQTGEWLGKEECVYLKEGRPVVILETNVNAVTKCNISCIKEGMDASTVTIHEAGKCSSGEKENGTCFEASRVNTGGGWYQYRYVIWENNFIKEGRYEIQIDSTDQAGNHSSNVSNKHRGRSLPITFAIDRTAPSVVVSGAGNGAIYNQAEHTLWLDVQDNLAMDSVSVYVNGEEYGTYTAKDIENVENGLIPVVIRQSLSTQQIQIKARDMAGNMLGGDAAGDYDKAFEDIRILVTRNVFVRFFHTTWLVIAALSVIIGGVIIVYKLYYRLSNRAQVY